MLGLHLFAFQAEMRRLFGHGECVFDKDDTIYVPYGKVDYYRQRIEQSCWGCIVELPKENATKIK
jgi:hypothetical protein